MNLWMVPKLAPLECQPVCSFAVFLCAPLDRPVFRLSNELKRADDLINGTLKPVSTKDWKELLREKRFFKKHKNFLQLIAFSQSLEDHRVWYASPRFVENTFAHGYGWLLHAFMWQSRSAVRGSPANEWHHTMLGSTNTEILGHISRLHASLLESAQNFAN